MRDVRLFELLEQQWNRVSLAQMQALGYTRRDVNRRVAAGRLRAVHEAVFAGRPFLDDLRGTWMAATDHRDGAVSRSAWPWAGHTRGTEDEEDHERWLVARG
jgi:hypothetical protein